MKPEVTDDQKRAVDASPGEPVEAKHSSTHKVFYIYDANLHQRASQALQQQEDFDAIQQGIEDMEAGRVIPFEEVDARIRKKLGLPDRA